MYISQSSSSDCLQIYKSSSAKLEGETRSQKMKTKNGINTKCQNKNRSRAKSLKDSRKLSLLSSSHLLSIGTQPQQPQKATSSAMVNVLTNNKNTSKANSIGQIISKRRTLLPAQTSFLGLIIQLLIMVLVIAVLIENRAICGMSKRFLKGFIMGAMFAHHHKP